jgi:hypothetical protein
MKLDGVDFWASNRHIVRLWDQYDRCGPMVVLIDDKVRVGKEFMVYMQTDHSNLYNILQRQSDMQREATMSVMVVDKKTGQHMYDVHLQVILRDLRFGDRDYSDSEPSEMYVTYMCLSAEDKTNYDGEAIRTIPGESMHCFDAEC